MAPPAEIPHLGQRTLRTGDAEAFPSFPRDPCVIALHPLGCLFPNQVPSMLHDLRHPATM
jgi:hypothetical protein